MSSKNNKKLQGYIEVKYMTIAPQQVWQECSEHIV